MVSICFTYRNIRLYTIKKFKYKIVQTNPKPNGKEWNYRYLSINPNITWGIVQTNPDKPWNYNLSQNPNITWEIVQQNPDKQWSYSYLSQNEMKTDKENYINKKCAQKISNTIFEELIQAVWHPKNIEKFKYLDPELDL